MNKYIFLLAITLSSFCPSLLFAQIKMIIPKNAQKLNYTKTELPIESKLIYPQFNVQPLVKNNDRLLSNNIVENTSIIDNTPNTEYSDNSLAISDYLFSNNYIVAVKNSMMLYYDINLNSYGSISLETVSGYPFQTLYFDPKVVYDAVYNRFVLTFLSIKASTNATNLFVLVSNDSTPTNGWIVLQIPEQNVINTTSQYDYPTLGMSTDEIFISMSAMIDNTTPGVLDHTTLLSLRKATLYDNNIPDTVRINNWADPANPELFTLQPASYGYQGNYGPGLHFVNDFSTSDGSTKDSIYLYSIDNQTYNNYSLYKSAYKIQPYKLPQDLPQLNSTDMVGTSDCRITSAYYLNDVIHYVFSKESISSGAQIAYGRIDLQTNNITEKYYENATYGCAYPSVAPFSLDSTDNTALIAFLESGATSYPGFHAISCDNIMDWSNDLALANGTTPHYPGWGHYTGAVREHTALVEVCWVYGCYASPSGDFNNSNYIAEIRKDNANHIFSPQSQNTVPIKVYPNPTHNTFNIKNNIANSENIVLQLIDKNGNMIQQLYEGKNSSCPNTFTTEKYLQGIYFLQIIITSTNQIGYEKIIFY